MLTAATSKELLVSGSHLLINDRQKDVIKNGGVVISGDAICAVGTRTELRKNYPSADQLHEPHGLVMPGLVNTHSHAAMRCFRGLVEDLPPTTAQHKHIFPLETEIDRKTVYHSTLLCIAEMIKSGTTSFCDRSLCSEEVARAAAQSGIRGWVGEALYDSPSASYGQLEDVFSSIEEQILNYQSHPLVTITVNPHSICLCSPALLKRSKIIAEENNTLFVIQLSQTRGEVKECLQGYHKTPVQHLESLGLLNEKTLAVHCLHLEPEDIELLAERGVKISHCQESNMKPASGSVPVAELLSQGVNVSIGIDGYAANNVDMFLQMNCLAKAQKAAAMDPTVMDAETTLRLATQGGASALGAADRLGTLAIGKKADLIVLDLNQPHLTPLYNVPSHLVYTARGADVIHSIINGRIVMRDRQLLTLNESDIIAGMTEISERILMAS